MSPRESISCVASQRLKTLTFQDSVNVNGAINQQFYLQAGAKFRLLKQQQEYTLNPALKQAGAISGYGPPPV